MRILVTGCRFNRSHLVDNLIESGYEVVGIDNLSYGSLTIYVRNQFKKFKFVKGDVKRYRKYLKNTLLI